MDEKLMEQVADLIEAEIDSTVAANLIIPLIRKDEREKVGKFLGDVEPLLGSCKLISLRTISRLKSGQALKATEGKEGR